MLYSKHIFKGINTLNIKETVVHSHLAKLMGQHIVEQRERQGIFQKELAEAIGISAQFLGRIERGDVKMPEEILLNTIEYLSLDQKKLNKIHKDAGSLTVDDLFLKLKKRKKKSRIA